MKLEGCRNGKHSECKRKLTVSFFEKDRWVETEEYYVCQCDKRGCECFVKAADRDKKSKRKPRKRKS